MRLGLLMLLSLLLVAAAAGWVLASQAGNQWLLRQVPGLEVEEFSGRLLGHWSATSLRWQDEQVGVVGLQQVQMQLNAACLLQLQLCVRSLQAQQLEIDLADGQLQTEVAGPVQLPAIRLPFAVSLQELQLGLVLLDGQLLVQQVQLQASVMQEQLRVQQLQLAYRQQLLQASGQLQMRDDWPLQMQVQLQLDSQLEQFAGEQQIQLQIDGSLHQLQLAASLQGLVGGSLQAEVAPLRQPLTASVQLDLRNRYGRLAGELQLQYDQAISWEMQLVAEDFNPQLLVAQLPGRIGGRMKLSGSWQDELQLVAGIDLAGELLGEQLHLQLQLQGRGEHWQLPALDLQLGASRLRGSVSLEQRLSGLLQLQVSELEELVPQAGGRLQADIRLSGSRQQPAVQLMLVGSELGYQDYQLGSLQAEFAGDLLKQQLSLQLDGQLQASASLQGELELERMNWQGTLDSLRLGGGEHEIWLAAPMQLDYLSGQLLLGEHCLLSAEQARLCATQRLQFLPLLDVAYQLHDFPLYVLQPWLPPELTLDGKVNGEIRLAQQAVGLQGLIRLDAGSGQLVYAAPERDYRLGWQQLLLQADLDEQQISTSLLLAGAETGQLQLQLQLDPVSADKTLSGSFQLQELYLHALQPMLPMLETLQGSLAGEGKISGRLLQPQIDGQLRLRNGAVAGGQLPSSLEDLWLDVQLGQDGAGLKGGWRSGEQGQASIEGQVSWRPQLSVDVALRASQLPVLVAPYADLLLDADVQLGYGERGLLLGGMISVPGGQIRVPELPVQAVRVSADARVAGREQSQHSLPLVLDLQIKAGQERLHFSGFGLTALVEGDMRMTDSFNGHGVLELKEGRYRAYGQRLQLRRARLVFSGPITQPYIDIEAVRVTGDVTAGLRLSGLASQPQTEIFSTPAMSQEQALSWLLLGRPLRGGGDDANMMGQAALALGVLGTTPIANRLADAFGIQEFQLDTEGSGLETSVVASGRVTDRLSVGYGVGVFQPGGIVILRYELTKRLYVEAASSLANSLDIFYRRSF